VLKIFSVHQLYLNYNGILKILFHIIFQKKKFYIPKLPVNLTRAAHPKNGVIEIFTSDRYFAGTKALVTLWITDIWGKMIGPVELESDSDKQIFGRNSDIFTELEYSEKG